MYVAVKGGERAIDNAHRYLADERRGDRSVPEITPEQIDGQLTLAVDRAMAEGSLYDRPLAATAIKQARGDLIEAIFLVRAYRTTMPRFAASVPIETERMTVKRRISATFKDLPGGQVLGPTFDYTHRLIDTAAPADTLPAAAEARCGKDPAMPRVLGLLDDEGLIEQDAPNPVTNGADAEPGDITQAPLGYPADRDVRLQRLARGDEGYLLALGYSTQRGYARTHPFAGEIRHGLVDVVIAPPELGFEIPIAEIDVTECQTVNQFAGGADAPPQFTQGYGLTFGFGERKAMAMALVDRALRARELGEDLVAPAQDEEFVLAHCDSVQSTGFVEHLKLPHYVDFQSELELVRKLRAEWQARRADDVAKAEAAE